MFRFPQRASTSINRSPVFLRLQAPISSEIVQSPIPEEHSPPHFIGLEPGSLKPIYARSFLQDRFLQVGKEDTDRRYYPVPKFAVDKDMTLDEALVIMSLPKTLGTHPDLKKDIILEVLNHELVLRMDGTRLHHPIGRRLKVGNVTLERALSMISAPDNDLPRDGRVGEYNGKMVHIMNGSNGYYVRYGQLTFDLPARFAHNPGAFTLADAAKLLMAYRAKRKEHTVKKGEAEAEVEVHTVLVNGTIVHDW